MSEASVREPVGLLWPFSPSVAAPAGALELPVPADARSVAAPAGAIESPVPSDARSVAALAEAPESPVPSDARSVAAPAGAPESPVPSDARSVAALAEALESLDPGDARDVELVEAVVGWQRVMSAALARQGEVIRELVVRSTGTRGGPYLPEELACALATTRHAAESAVHQAVALGSHPALHDALVDGHIDGRKLTAVLDELPGSLSDEARRRVVLDAVVRAPELTAPQLRRHVRRTVLLACPREVEARAARARQGRHVRLEWGDDAMAWVSAYLPAPDAVAVYTVVDALAGTSAPGGDDRNVDQRRADALADVFRRILDSQDVPGVGPLPRRRGRQAAVQVTVAATTLLGLDDAPAELGSFGPIPASMARELAQDATWTRVLTDPATGVALEAGATTYRPGADLTRTVIARDVTCTFFGCRQPAARCDLDHVVPFDGSRRTRPQTTAANLHALCRRHHRAKTHGDWSVGRDPTTGSTWWTSPLGITTVRPAVRLVASPQLLDPHAPPNAPASAPPNHSPNRPPPGDPPF